MKRIYGEMQDRPFAREEAVAPERLDVPVRIRGGGLGGMVITALGRMRGGGLGGMVITALGRMRVGGVPPNLQLSVAPLVFGRISKSVL